MRRRRDDEEARIRTTALANARSIRAARQEAERELLRAKEDLERRTAELARSLSMIHATLESTSDAILVTDDARRVTGHNAKYAALWRLTPEIMQAADHHRILDHIRAEFDDGDAFVARVVEIYDQASPESFDVLLLRDGRVLERTSRIQFVEGRGVGRVWCFRDVTERVRAEEALRAETRMLELLNRTGTTLASQLDLQSLLQSATDAATQLSDARFGVFFCDATDADGDAYVLHTLSGVSREAFERLVQPRATPHFGPAFRGGAAIRCDDVRRDPRYGGMDHHRGVPPGHLPVVSYLAVPVVSRSGAVAGGMFFGHPEAGVFTERSERLVAGIAAQAALAIDNARMFQAAQHAADERNRLLESERAARSSAERTSALKDDFLATLSHELRTPLSAILGWSTILRRGGSTPQELTQGLETIERNARVQTQLIEDLLDMSRITSGKLRLDVQTVVPMLVVEAAIATLGPTADAKGVRLEKLLDPSAGPVAGDPGRLQQIVWNLLSNAIKFTPRGGKVQVILHRVDSQVEISVADTGIGVDPQFLPHVFDRFRQADASSTRSHSGLGLGLAIVKSLVELHGGHARVTSAGEGQGTTFTVSLPLSVVRVTGLADERRHPSAAAPALPAYEPFDLNGIRVLVVDDEQDARTLVERLLVDCGAQVFLAGTADEALALVERERPHLMVSDIGMPGVDGYELLRRIRALGARDGVRVPAIALTAFARSEDRTRALRAGFLAHVAKPVEASELIATIASVVGRTETTAAE
jgi:signal transduction histidine kinase/CheY-like chemotaxis protein/PAS domain-containing protein